MKHRDFYLGLDIGTDSVGYAVTNEKYDLLKLHGDDAWGVQVFDAASLSAERRSFRSARRRLDRRQQRVLLIQELFAQEIAKVDPKFYLHIKESALYGKDATDPCGKGLFRDDDFSDETYFYKYPTIHHLICELMTSEEPHDVRLVYLACSWLVAHRGHFLSNIDAKNIDAVKDFGAVYDRFTQYFLDNGYEPCWNETDKKALSDIIKTKMGVGKKQKALTDLLFAGAKPSKQPTVDFPYSREGLIKLIAGGTYKLKDLFGNDAYEEFGSITLGMDEEKFVELAGNIGDDYDLISLLRDINDWAVLVDVLGPYNSISEAKVAVYEQHKKDLAFLKYFVRKYLSKEKYDEVFRTIGTDNYAAYVYHTDEKNTSDFKKKDKEAFSKYLSSIVKDIQVSSEDEALYSDMKNRLDNRIFLPKQRNTDNRVIPHQMYEAELYQLIAHAEKYLPFLTKADEEGLTVSDKIVSVFKFRIPYFVGPLNKASKHAWYVSRKQGKIYPWNFEQMVDFDASEAEFIKKLTNSCTYLPGESVLPKDSLCYHKYMVLNEINNIRINGQRISVELKQRLFNELFMNVKKVTLKRLQDWLISNGELDINHRESLTGIDDDVKSNLMPQIAYKRLIASGILSIDDAEKIIERASYAEDKSRLMKWLCDKYPELDEVDKKYICGIKVKDFGRLSRKFLDGIEGVNKETGEVTTILGALWNTQYNLMEILSDKFTFNEAINDLRVQYYGGHNMKLVDKLDEMYISNAVRRPIYRTLDIVNDIKKAFGVPKKIFVEMARGGAEDQKGVRTKSRKQQLLDLYQECKDLDVKLLQQQLEDMGDAADSKLQSDKLFLYFTQLGKCMYTGKSLELDKLSSELYNIDHIYPQAFVKDDSILNNKVLVYSEENGAKKDGYPIAAEIRQRMGYVWDTYRKKGLITEEKYRRLVRSTPFTEDEKHEFINRQLVETSQSTKAVATLLKEQFPDTEIVYCKAKLTSEFRQEFDLYKSRLFNDLHHAVDAYLNIVTGNVYNMRFTKKWFDVNSEYSVKTKTIFTRPLTCGGMTIWDGANMLDKVKKTAVKNTAHFNKYAYFKRGGLFDQRPVCKGEGLTPLKKGMSTEQYGGYNKAGVMFFIPVKYVSGKKSGIIIMSVELMHGEHFLGDMNFAEAYSLSRLEHILGYSIDEVSFPMGMRPWKVNTVLSLDGFRVNIAGSSGGGKCLIAQPSMQFYEDSYWQFYLKKLEMFVKKIQNNVHYFYSEKYDKVSIGDNIRLYDVYLEKFERSIYSLRWNAPIALLKNGKAKFAELDIKNQCLVLLNIHQAFGRIAGGCDLSLIGEGKRAAATVNFSSSVANWKKTYQDVRIIDISASGLWETKSQNLLELL